MIDATDPPRRRSSQSLRVVTPLSEARVALNSARTIVEDLETTTSPGFGKLRDVTANWARLKQLLHIIGLGLAEPKEPQP